MEQNLVRKRLFEQLMKVQHRQYEPMVKELALALEGDPYFAGRALCYMFGQSVIRDQQDAAVITLLQSDPDLGLREAGSALFGLGFLKTRHTSGFKPLPPYRLLRVWDYIRKSSKRTPERMRELMVGYIRHLEAKEGRFDGVALLNRTELKSVYTTYHISPSAFAQALLFDDKPPETSKLHWVKVIAQEQDLARKALLAVEHDIPYTILSSLLAGKDAASLVALVNAMTPTQAANSVAWVEQSGILSMPEVKKVFLEKVSQAKGAASLTHRKSSQAKTADVAEAIQQATDADVALAPRIEAPVAVLVDRSGSMEQAISAGIELFAHISSLIDNPSENARLVFFNDYAARLVVKNGNFSLSNLQAAARQFRAGGQTSMVAGLQAAYDGFEPQKLVFVTDGGENVGKVAQVIANIAQENLHIVIVGVGAYQPAFTRSFEERGLHVDEFRYMGDYYTLDQVGRLIAGPRGKTLVEQILEIELPEVIK